MNGNDDFFGGSAAPEPNPAMTNTREYADFTTGVQPPVQSTANPLLAVILIVVGILVAVAAFAGYRVMMSGTQIEIPKTLMGMERMDADSPLALQIEEAMSASSDVWGDVDVEVGVFQSGEQILFVMGGADGLSGPTDDYFAGFEDGFNQSGVQGTLVEADPGARGGELRCITIPSGGTCAWIGDDTFGAFAMSPMDSDPASIAQQIRDTIEK